ncbi:hypothetical protein [Bradyrhizobium sp. URHD0069]|uniref:hypothetical protein n=1 Tax=Bradyrhizobium sp. URHD0069 TaxID=1380355 RepID=UPI0012DC4B1B
MLKTVLERTALAVGSLLAIACWSLLIVPGEEADCKGCSSHSQLRQHLSAEGVDELSLVYADLMELELFKAEFDELVQPGGMSGRVRRDQCLLN